jgi:hypothetical protein
MEMKQVESDGRCDTTQSDKIRAGQMLRGKVSMLGTRCRWAGDFNQSEALLGVVPTQRRGDISGYLVAPELHTTH